MDAARSQEVNQVLSVERAAARCGRQAPTTLPPASGPRRACALHRRPESLPAAAVAALRDGRVIGRGLVQRDVQELPQAQRIGRAPRHRPFRRWPAVVGKSALATHIRRSWFGYYPPNA